MTLAEGDALRSRITELHEGSSIVDETAALWSSIDNRESTDLDQIEVADVDPLDGRGAQPHLDPLALGVSDKRLKNSAVFGHPATKTTTGVHEAATLVVDEADRWRGAQVVTGRIKYPARVEVAAGDQDALPV